MTDKTEKQVVGTNALAIKWPQDPQGTFLELKRGGVKAATRVNGNKDKMKRLLETLKIIEAHAKAKYTKDVEARKVVHKNGLAARARVAEKRARQAEAKAKEYDAAAKRVRESAGIKAGPVAQ